MMKRFLLFSIVCLVALISCKSTSKTGKTVVEKPISYKKILSDYSDRMPDYESMKSDIKLDADLDNASYRASGEIRHVRGKGVFISVKKIGFEIGRVWITPDSFFVLNRWDKEYVREPISVIEESYQIKGEYDMVEEILTGIPKLGPFVKSDKTTVEGEYHRIDLPSYYRNIDLVLWLDSAKQAVRQAYYQDDKGRGVRMKYQAEAEQKLIIERELHTENIDDEIHVRLIYKNPTFNRTLLPVFDVPSHYTRRRF